MSFRILDELGIGFCWAYNVDVENVKNNLGIRVYFAVGPEPKLLKISFWRGAGADRKETTFYNKKTKVNESFSQPTQEHLQFAWKSGTVGFVWVLLKYKLEGSKNCGLHPIEGERPSAISSACDLLEREDWLQECFGTEDQTDETIASQVFRAQRGANGKITFSVDSDKIWPEHIEIYSSDSKAALTVEKIRAIFGLIIWRPHRMKLAGKRQQLPDTTRLPNETASDPLPSFYQGEKGEAQSLRETLEDTVVDNPENRSLWISLAHQSAFLKTFGRFDAVMVDDWSPTKPTEIKLAYDKLHQNTKIYDERNLPELIRPLFKQWVKENSSTYKQLNEEGASRRTRFNGLRYSDEEGWMLIELSPIKYLFYEAIHGQLHKQCYSEIREKVFQNAVTALKDKQPPILPSHFAIHLAVVTKDNQLLLRKRTSAAIFRDCWEIGIGEFFNGPEIVRHSHFNAAGEPDMVEYARQAVSEELGYENAKPQDFTFYGIGVELASLAPKLLGVYESDLDGEQLRKTSQKATDKRRFCDYCEATPESLAEALASGDYSPRTPMSDLAAWCAVTRHVDSDKHQREMVASFQKKLVSFKHLKI